MALSEIYNDVLITFSHSSEVYLPSDVDATVYTIDVVTDVVEVAVIISEDFKL